MDNAQYTKQFITSIVKNGRYYVVAGILLFSLVFLKDITGDLGQAGSYADNELFGSSYSITQVNSSFIFPNNQEYKPGDYYHLTYKVKYIGWAAGSTTTTSSAALNFLVDNSKGSWVTVGTVKLATAGLGYQELYFKPDAAFHTIRFEGSGIFPDVSQVFVSDVNVEALNVTTASQLPSLAKTTFGDYAVTPNQQTMSADQATSAYDFITKQREMGQIFKAQDSYMQSAELKLAFVGGGGVGNYKVTLRAVSGQPGNLQVSSDVLTSFDATALEAQTIYQDPNQPGLFRFPLYAKLNVGQYYYVGIQNNVSFDLPNHLQMFGNSKNVYADGYAYDARTGKSYTNYDLYLRIYGVADSVVGPGALLPSEKISDLGQGQYSFSFNEDADPFSRVWSVDDGTNTTWTIPTTHYLSSLTVATKPTPLVADGSSTLSYSYDGKTWTDVELSLDSPSQISLTPSVNTKTLYLRYPSGVFGSLSVEGSLHD